jgi:hypothetical protein
VFRNVVFLFGTLALIIGIILAAMRLTVAPWPRDCVSRKIRSTRRRYRSRTFDVEVPPVVGREQWERRGQGPALDGTDAGRPGRPRQEQERAQEGSSQEADAATRDQCFVVTVSHEDLRGKRHATTQMADW